MSAPLFNARDTGYEGTMPLHTLIIVTDTIPRLHTELRRLTIPPHLFLRGVHVVLPGDRESFRGLSKGAWCLVPGCSAPQGLIVALATQRVPEFGFHEAVARRLAWRVWHAQ